MERKRKREKETPTTNPKPYTLKEEPNTKYIGESNRSGLRGARNTCQILRT